MTEEKVSGTQITLDISSLPQGLYWVRMENVLFKRFVIPTKEASIKIATTDRSFVGMNEIEVQNKMMGKFVKQ